MKKLLSLILCAALALPSVSSADRAEIEMGLGAGGVTWATAGYGVYPIQVDNGDWYQVFFDGGQDVYYRKSTDGVSYGQSIAVFTGAAVGLAVWFDGWSGLTGGLIHIAYQETATDDVLYRTIATESSDTLSTQTVIMAGSAQAGGGSISITRARGGNVYVATQNGSQNEGGFFKLLNANVPAGAWEAALTTVYEASADDQVILMPGFGADNQDVIGIYMDASANELSSKFYDDSGNSWSTIAERVFQAHTNIATVTSNAHYAAAPDLANSQIIVVGWTAIDTVNADLLAWAVDESADTALTDVVTNSTDDQGFAAIAIDTMTGDFHVGYGGKSDGSETYSTGLNFYSKTSTDDGSTWGAETQFSIFGSADTRALFASPNFTDYPQYLMIHNNVIDQIFLNTELPAGAPGGGLALSPLSGIVQ